MQNMLSGNLLDTIDLAMKYGDEVGSNSVMNPCFKTLSVTGKLL